MSEIKSDNQPVEYDPTKHDGLLYVAGHEIIVADASQAKLCEMPLEYRKIIAQETEGQLALMDFSRGDGGVIIEITDPVRATKMEEGYKKGLELLHLTGDDHIDSRSSKS